MPQSSSVYPDLTVIENLQYFALMSGLPKKQANLVIDEVKLSKYSHQLVNTLSGGQKARVSLAIALLGNPKILVLDEPTVGVDPLLRQQLWALFFKFTDRGTTILITSHVMDEATHCQNLLLLRNGKLLAEGSPKELCERTGTATVEESFLHLVRESK
jgi:ABC-2 type transport system ATP-binding protein